MHASQAAQPPRSPQPQKSRQPQQRSKSDPGERELNSWLHSAGSAKRILDLVQRHHQLFDKIHAVTTLQTLAKLSPKMRAGFTSHTAWPLLLDTLHCLMPLFEPRQLSSAVSACGGLDVKPVWLSQLLSAAEASMQTRPQLWNLLSLSACLDGLARLQYEDDLSILAVAQQILPRLLPGADARDISSAVWSLSKRRHGIDSDTVDAISVRFLEVLPQAPSQSIVNLLYGLAMMNAALATKLLDGCAERLATIVGDATAQNISNAIWALGQLGHCPAASTLQTLLQAEVFQVCFRVPPGVSACMVRRLTHGYECRPPRCRIAA